jgi:uncharacterized protein
MTHTDRYIPGVPCFIDSMRRDPHAAAAFYGELFGWDYQDVMPESGSGTYLMARLDGRDVAGLGSSDGVVREPPVWSTYVWVTSADEAAASAVAAGATVVMEPTDMFEAGRMAVLADPEGAELCLWEPRKHRGAGAVNEPGTLVFNVLHTRDLGRAAEFYNAVFGWEVVDIGGEPMWALTGYGDFLDELNPGTLAGLAASGAPAGFENVVAAIETIGAEDADTRPHWGVTFGVDDTDATVKLAAELGGTVLVEPVDAPWVRYAVIADPQGAVFTASQYVPDQQ